MGNLIDGVMNKRFSRRKFLAASAAGVASLALPGCGNQLTATSGNVTTTGEGKWVPAACWNNCGGRCANYAYVVDGIVVRQKTDDMHEDTLDSPQERACLRGRSQRRHLYGPDRLKYPMKRKHWEPITGGDKSLRGIDEWERITWDEAFDYITAELKHILATYEPRSVFVPGNAGSGAIATMDALGGCSYTWSTGSEGSFRFMPTKSFGFTGYPDKEGSDRFEMQKVDNLIFYGANPAWASGGNTTYLLDQLKKNGTKFVSVGPMYDTTACAFNAEWVPVRIGTDNAFLAAVAYTMLEEDDPQTNPIIDWDFIDRCTVGFDDDRMLEGAQLNENFKGYILGKYDGIPKTPEWATEICGTPVDKIRWYARLLRKDNNTYIGFSMAPGRQKGAESFPQMLMAIAAMGGHFGKEGHGCSPMYYNFGGNDGYSLLKSNIDTGVKTLYKGEDCISTCEMWDAVVDGKYTSNGPGARSKMWNDTPEVKDIDIRMIWYEACAPLATQTDMRKGIEANRKVDFVLNQSFTYRAEAQFADIILPVSTPWERFEGFGRMVSYGFKSREWIFAADKVTEPYFESKSDQWIYEQIPKRMGVEPQEIFTYSLQQQAFSSIVNAEVIKDDLSGYEPLVTIEQDDIDNLQVEGKPQSGRIPFKQLMKQGSYRVARHKGDQFSVLGFKKFYEDPENNPRLSTSKKMEFYSDYYAHLINNLGHHPTFRIKPYPTYQPYEDGYEYTFENHDIKSGKKGKYPFQVFTPHYLRSSHATYGNVDWIQEAMPQPAYVNASDAESKGVKDGDTILIYNERGKILRHACTTERLMPGQMAVSHGGWLDWDEKNGICRGGSENMISGGTTVSGISAYNSCLVDFVKYDGEPLVADSLKPRRLKEV